MLHFVQFCVMIKVYFLKESERSRFSPIKYIIIEMEESP